MIPLCPVFGTCGGCQYQHLPYEEELKIKQATCESLFADYSIEPIIPSPRDYAYRNRLDIGFRRLKTGELLFGFRPGEGNRMVQIEACPIARPEISAFLPKLKSEAFGPRSTGYKIASLVVKTGDDKRVLWGGMGKGSLRQKPEDYLWTEISGKKIFYSLDTFFQANTFIIPEVIKIMNREMPAGKKVFYDLYGGVGLFSIFFAEKFEKIFLVENNPASIRLARFNAEHHQLKNMEIIEGDVGAIHELPLPQGTALIDPPRAGLSKTAAEFLAGWETVENLFYLSCNPESLARDLKIFVEKGWQVKKIIPFDFFPRTKHLEALAVLQNVA